MKLYYYIVTRDYGFAPNPFKPCCTLATCKPNIRKCAQIDDWVVGVGSNAKDSKFKNKLIYVMKVEEKLTFDEYWIDPRFKTKRPVMNGSLRQKYGDNIYHRIGLELPYIQEDSHHSYPNGVNNKYNYDRDLKGEFVLISNKFWYFGEEANLIPYRFLQLTEVRRGYKVIEDEQFINSFYNWLLSLPQSSYIGEPTMFKKGFRRYSGK